MLHAAAATAACWEPSTYCRFIALLPQRFHVSTKWPASLSTLRTIFSFTAADPVPLVPGGLPCLKLEVHGSSFLLHHIRHMIGGAIAVAAGVMPLDLLRAALSLPTRVAVPRAPPHSLFLSDVHFHEFPNTGDLPRAFQRMCCIILPTEHS